MAYHSQWPVVQPLPKIIVKLIVWGLFFAGQVLLWNDRRKSKARVSIEKPVGLPAFK